MSKMDRKMEVFTGWYRKSHTDGQWHRLHCVPIDGLIPTVQSTTTLCGKYIPLLQYTRENVAITCINFNSQPKTEKRCRMCLAITAHTESDGTK